MAFFGGRRPSRPRGGIRIGVGAIGTAFLLLGVGAIIEVARCAPVSADAAGSAGTADSSAAASQTAGDSAPGPAAASAPAPAGAPPSDPEPERDAALDQAAQAAVDHAAARGESAAVAVYDRQTSTLYAAGDYLAEYSSASVVKIAIAGQLLASGQMAGVEATARAMIARSDDDAATALYEMAGGDGVMQSFASRYGLEGYFGPPLEDGWWGTTRISAAGVVLLYDAIADDPVVGPWLMDAMGSAQCIAADGYAQCFGIASATDDWRIKQGWSADDPGDVAGKIHSTGYVGGDRFAVAILTSGSPWIYGSYGNETATGMARILMPDGSML